jgi:hypothetical protein
MKLREISARPGLTLSIEFFPPKTAKGDAEVKEIAVLQTLQPAFCARDCRLKVLPTDDRGCPH